MVPPKTWMAAVRRALNLSAEGRLLGCGASGPGLPKAEGDARGAPALWPRWKRLLGPVHTAEAARGGPGVWGAPHVQQDGLAHSGLADLSAAPRSRRAGHQRHSAWGHCSQRSPLPGARNPPGRPG